MTSIEQIVDQVTEGLPFDPSQEQIEEIRALFSRQAGKIVTLNLSDAQWTQAVQARPSLDSMAISPKRWVIARTLTATSGFVSEPVMLHQMS